MLLLLGSFAFIPPNPLLRNLDLKAKRQPPYNGGVEGGASGLADLLDVALARHLDALLCKATMNSVAGNKERLAVSTRGKKYGVSCDGQKRRRVTRATGRGAHLQARAAPSRLQPRRLPARPCMRGGGSAAGTCTPPGAPKLPGPSFLAFPAPLTFAVFPDL